MKSHRWKVLLSEKPAIYNLPTEILLLVIDYIECILTLRALRSVSRRFEQLTRSMLFKDIHMDKIKPSHMPVLVWVLTRNPSLLVLCRSLHLQLCGWRLTLEYPRTPSTRAQDESQSLLISSLPNLQKVSIWIGNVFEIIYPGSNVTGRLGFSRTLDALFQCSSLEELYLRGSYQSDVNSFLLDLFSGIGERLQRLSIDESFINSFLRIIGIADIRPGGTRSLPIFVNLTRVTLHLDFLTKSEFDQLSTMLSRHSPNINTLVCIVVERSYARVDEDELQLPTMNPLTSLSIERASLTYKWMITIPTRRLELGFHETRQYSVLNSLVTLITSKSGIFQRRIVESIKLTIDVTPLHVDGLLYPGPLEETKALAQDCMSQLQKSCHQTGITLVTTFQTL